MVVTPLNRHLLVQLQIGTTAAGTPKLKNCVYQHVDVTATDDTISTILSAMAPLFTDSVYSMGRVDSVGIQPDATTTTV